MQYAYISSLTRFLAYKLSQQHKFRAPAKPVEPPTPRTSVLGLDRLAKEKREAAAALERNDHKRSRRDDDPVFKGWSGLLLSCIMSLTFCH